MWPLTKASAENALPLCTPAGGSSFLRSLYFIPHLFIILSCPALFPVNNAGLGGSNGGSTQCKIHCCPLFELLGESWSSFAPETHDELEQINLFPGWSKIEDLSRSQSIEVKTEAISGSETWLAEVKAPIEAFEHGLCKVVLSTMFFVDVQLLDNDEPGRSVEDWETESAARIEVISKAPVIKKVNSHQSKLASSRPVVSRSAFRNDRTRENFVQRNYPRLTVWVFAADRSHRIDSHFLQCIFEPLLRCRVWLLESNSCCYVVARIYTWRWLIAPAACPCTCSALCHQQ